MANDLLNIGIGSLDRSVTVDSVEEIEVPVNGKQSKKVLFKVSQKDGKTFNISDAWVNDSKGMKKIQGLWLSLDETGNIAASSALAKFLKHHNFASLGEAVGKEVKTFPDHNNYLVFTAVPVAELQPLVDTPAEDTEKANLFD
tara:strand:- start:520 stop:948 length:429 start_codon:yes stop_codon:yes gene_type:complete